MLLFGTAFGWLGHNYRDSKRKKFAFEKLTEIHAEKSWRYFDEDKPRLLRYESVDILYAGAEQDWFSINILSDKFPASILSPITGTECFDELLRLDLSNLKLMDADLEYVCAFKELTSLTANNTAVTDRGIVELTTLPLLRRLGLSRTDISDQSLAHLIKMKNLEELDIWHTRITDNGIEHLAKLKNLKKLNCCGTGVTESGIKYLQAEIPQCQIWWNENETFQALNQIPTFMGELNYDPRKSIVAFNQLKLLGKEGVIEAMREYCKVSSMESFSDQGFCQTRLRSIFPILFTPKKLPPAIPQTELFPNLPLNVTAPTWPYSVLQLQGNIPFRTLNVNGRFGPPLSDCNFLIDWAEENCDFDSTTLTPADNPRPSFDELVHKLNLDDQNRLTKWEKDQLENQLLTLLGGLDPENGIRWDRRKQKYVSKH